MTQHVVTRQYRAPEVILCSGNYRLLTNATPFLQPATSTQSCPRPDVAYSQAIDVWSVGCILAELLELLKVRFS